MKRRAFFASIASLAAVPVVGWAKPKPQELFPHKFFPAIDQSAFDAAVGIKWDVQEFDYGTFVGVLAELPNGYRNAMGFSRQSAKNRGFSDAEMTETCKRHLRKWAETARHE